MFNLSVDPQPFTLAIDMLNIEKFDETDFVNDFFKYHMPPFSFNGN